MLQQLADFYGAAEIHARERGLVVVRPEDAAHGLLDLPVEWPMPWGEVVDVDVVRPSDMPVHGLGWQVWPFLRPGNPIVPDPTDYASRRARQASLADSLAARHPMLSRERPGESSYRYWGMEHGPGWIPIVDAMASAIEEHCAATGAPLPTIVQLKEKFGGMRCYLDRADNTALAVVDAAEHLSERVCEHTGRPGLLGVLSGWHCTLAPDLDVSEIGREGQFVPSPREGGVRLADGVAGALDGLQAAWPDLSTDGLPVGWVDLVDALCGVLAQEHRTWRGDMETVSTGGRVLAAYRSKDGTLEMVVETYDPGRTAAVAAFGREISRLVDTVTGVAHPQG